MSIREAITDISSFLVAAPPRWRTPKLAEVSQDQSRRAAMIRSAIPDVDLEALQKKFQQAIKTNDWSPIDPLDWSAISHYLWKSPLQLLSIHRFHFNYRRYLESNKTARTIKRLIYAYLEAYEPRLEGIEWAGSLIRKILVQKRFLVLDYWRKIDFELQIFSTPPGPQLFTAQCLNHPLSALHPLEHLGLIGPLSTVGFTRQAYLLAQEQMTETRWETPDELLRLERFLEWSQSYPSPFLRFPAEGPNLLKILLTKVPNSPLACELIGSFLTKYAEAWHRKDPTCVEPTPQQIEIVGKILTKATKY